MENEVFHHISPGLWHYAKNCWDAANSLQPLLQKALTVVPDLKALETWVILKATAGLSLILKECANNIKVCCFRLTDVYLIWCLCCDLSRWEERGFNAWWSWWRSERVVYLNFLLGKLHSISNSIATLDLGGGSTQITFATNNSQTLVSLEFELLLKVIVKRDIEGEPEYIYTDSYLGYGLMSARKALLLNNYINY